MLSDELHCRARDQVKSEGWPSCLSSLLPTPLLLSLSASTVHILLPTNTDWTSFYPTQFIWELVWMLQASNNKENLIKLSCVYLQERDLTQTALEKTCVKELS